MRITVTRTGGFGGLTRRATLSTDGRTDAADLAALARSALAEGRTERPLGVPDGFQYEIETDDGVGYCADPRLTEAQSALIRRVFADGG
ncbi:protealysin inhibitor emfourin [Streptomyces nanshensis]|uniref:Metalloprotease n=1 Tax=Streptomyces nanshensis TaxID=518642 RepID=A0A1E7KXD2_9ACTN|nr:protealysin inhibitor emfourin [Streptomyces nanshensis]OEV08579.1 metalloprotease [Streptomyces nanshensis]